MAYEIVKQSKFSLKNNQGLINLAVDNYFSEIGTIDKEVEITIKSCFRQSVEFADIQSNVSIETRPLIQFYAILNLVKVFTILKNGYKSKDIVSKFRSHGASSIEDDNIRIQDKGTFSEFLAVIQRDSLSQKEFSLVDLYKRIPDMSELLPMVFCEPSCDYCKVEDAQRWMMRTGCLDANINFRRLIVKDDHKKIITTIYAHELKIENINGKNCVMSSAKDNNIVDLLSFDVDGGLYLDINCKSINEFTAIYLIFLKYSSLSRYQPAEWFDKINSKELVIIEKILNDIFLKFWSKIAKELSPNRDVYLI